MTDIIDQSNHRQRVVLRIGAVYDAGFGVLMLAVPVFATGLLKVPMPDPGAIWIRLLGICLISLGLIYWIMSQNPARYLGIVAVILFGKFVSVAFYTIGVFVYDQARMFLLFALLDVIMFILHYWALGPGGWARIRESMEPARVVSA
jgi:hypothetical protein